MINKINDILFQVDKPARYIGGEMNLADFDKRNPRVKIALAFPDIYDVGMSYFGFKILYELINSFEQFQAERTFAPWLDMEEMMREKNIPLYCVDTFTKVSDFDLIGFTLQNELCQTNVLNMLDLAGLKIKSTERSDAFPLVIAGGPGAYNPEPMSDFIDCFVIGDGEDVIIEILNAVDEFKAKKSNSKEELLRKLARIQGVYVPSFYNITYKDSMAVDKFEKKYPDLADVIEKRIVDISKSDFRAVNPLVPYLKIVQDRFIVEARRGCARGCRFCHAGMTTRPIRERSVEDILELAHCGIENTGFNEVSLLSLSITDHSSIDDVLNCLTDAYSQRMVSVLLPSLRINTFSIELAKKVKEVRKATLTFAPEAGSERLRAVINKHFSEEEFFNVIREVIKAGWKSIKLYFMVGLPTETYEDLDGILDMLKKIRKIAQELKVFQFNINLSLSPFVPKPHTPFQWAQMLDMEEVEKRYRYVESGINFKNVSLKRHNVKGAYIESIFSRGDRRLGKALALAFEKGLKFDSWDKNFDFEKWMNIFEELGINQWYYTNPDLNIKEDILPWDHISCGVDKQYLVKEFNLAQEAKITSDCTLEDCEGCGVCEQDTTNMLSKNKIPDLNKIKELTEKIKSKVYDHSTCPQMRVRIRYTKDGILKYISHLDLIKSLHLLLNRTNLKMSYTQGFNPQIKTQFTPPLPLGFESISEYVDLYLNEPTSPEIILKELVKVNQKHIKFLSVGNISPINSASLESSIISAQYEISVVPFEENKGIFNKKIIDNKINEFFSKDEFIINSVRNFKSKNTDLRQIVQKISVEKINDSAIRFDCTVSMGEKGTYNPLKALNHILNYDLQVIGNCDAVRTGFGFAGA